MPYKSSRKSRVKARAGGGGVLWPRQKWKTRKMKDLREKILQEGKGHKPRLSLKMKTQKFLTIPHSFLWQIKGRLKKQNKPMMHCYRYLQQWLVWLVSALIFITYWYIRKKPKYDVLTWIFFSILLALCVVNPTVKVGYSSQIVSNTPVWMVFDVAWTSCESNSEVSNKSTRYDAHVTAL